MSNKDIIYSASGAAGGAPSYSLYTTGLDQWGGLGDGTAIHKTDFTYQLTPSSVVQVASGDEHTIIRLFNGTIWSWGRGNTGALGQEEFGVPSSANRFSPRQIGTVTTWTQVVAGRNTSFGIRSNGTLWAWGENSNGQLGLGNTTARSTPVQVGTLSDWAQVSTHYSTVAVKTDGTLWTWGNNTYGQLGDGTTTSNSSPVQIGFGETNWSKVSMGEYHVAAIKTNGTLWTWGRNANGQLGSGTTTDRSSPVQVGTLSNWSQVFCGLRQTFAIKTDGTLWAWGSGSDGQLGLNDTGSRSSPVQVGTFTDWSTVAPATYHTLAIRTNGTLWAWGRNDYGQQGRGNTVYGVHSPVQVGSATNWTIVAGSTNGSIGHGFAGNSTGALYPAGYGGSSNSDNYLLGIPNPLGAISRSSPVLVGTQFSSVASAESGFNANNFCAIKSNGTLWAWGVNIGYAGNYILGTNDNQVYSTPVQIGSLNNWSKISGGRNGFHAVKTDGTLWAWGYNQGMYGNSTTVSQSSPVQIGTLSNWAQIARAGEAAAAIKTNGTLWTWGDNQYGQLGNGNTTYLNSTAQVGALSDWAQISGGAFGFAAIKTNGTLWAWGGNSAALSADGVLGDGTTVNKSSPVQIGTLSNWAQVSMARHSLAVKTDGTLWAWGINSQGQLGTGNTTSYSSPVQIGTLSNWAVAKTFNGFSLAVKTDGTLWAWGLNDNGQLGTGNTTNYSSPVQVGTLSNWKDLIDSKVNNIVGMFSS